MSNCCSSQKISEEKTRTHYCPANGKPYASVKLKTVLHHVRQPWCKLDSDRQYYFCTDPACDVVYFDDNNSVLNTSDVRTTPWQKSKDKNAAICYCFGVSQTHAEMDNSIKAFVIEQTKKSLCSCETSNPSGRCCLKDFPIHYPKH